MSVRLKENERIDKLIGEKRIIQSSSTPSFAIDAVILADFVSMRAVGEARKAFDLGSGTGIIPLLLAEKMPQLQITGIEIMEQMHDQASRSVSLNDLDDRIKMIHADLRQIKEHFPPRSADIVVANPPYFKLGQGRVNDDPLFAAARQEQYSTLDDIIAAAAYLLCPKGQLYLINRAERLAELMLLLAKYQLNPRRLRMVQPYADKEANLMLVEARACDKGKLVTEPPLIVYAEQGCYTKEMQDIYDR